jgi:YHS domain-containing protein
MTTEVAKDPICGRSVEIGLNTPMSLYRKRAYYFCSWACQTVFEAFPESRSVPDEGSWPEGEQEK